MKNIIFRPATANDAEAIASSVWELKAEDRPLNPADKDEYVKNAAGHIRNRLGRDLFPWVAYDGACLVANINVVAVNKLPKPGMLHPKWGRISNVRTAPEYRNKGVGSILMEKVIAWAQEQEFEELLVCPSELSVTFYERAGFKSENDVMELLLE